MQIKGGMGCSGGCVAFDRLFANGWKGGLWGQLLSALREGIFQPRRKNQMAHRSAIFVGELGWKGSKSQMQKGNANGKMFSFCGLNWQQVGLPPRLKANFSGLHFLGRTIAFNILWLLVLFGLSERFEVPFLFFCFTYISQFGFPLRSCKVIYHN